MAETLGTIASILQLVDVALKAREYIQDFRHALQEQEKILSEMDDLRPLLVELQRRITADPSRDILKTMQTPLTAFKSTMEDLTQTIKPANTGLSKFARRLTWSMWSKKEAKEYLDKLEQFKTLLNSWLLLDIWDMGQQQRSDHDAILKAVEHTTNKQQLGHDRILSGIDDAAHDHRQHIDSEIRTKIIDWLSPINFFLRQADITRLRQLGTGEWLLATTQFQQWESALGEKLWCRGMPGAGKTTLASMVIEHLGAQSPNQNIGIACIYLNHKETETQTPSNLLASVWRQLMFGKSISSFVHKLYQLHSEKRTPASLDEILQVLNSTVTEWSKVYIVVDALDEYPEDKRHILLGHLAGLGPSVSLMLTSRPHISLNATFPDLNTVDIRAHEEDVHKYVCQRIKESPRLSKHVNAQPELQQELLTRITSHADRMFLLAKLHIESLGAKSTIKTVREAFKRLPKDLDNTYNAAMKRIQDQNEEDRKIANKALVWVSNAKRLLTVAELREALAIEPGAKQLDPDNMLDIDIILSVCAGLVIVDEKIPVVRLVHHTTQSYLDSIQDQQFSDAQSEITSSLLTFLAFDQFRNLSRLDPEKLPQLFYYAQYCLMHAAGRPEGQLREMLLDFFERAPAWRTFAGLKWTVAPWSLPDWKSEGSPMWIAVAANLLEIVRYYLKLRGVSPTTHNGKFIYAASYYGHLQMVELLIEKRTDVWGTVLGYYGSPMQAASWQGHEKIVQLLIDKGGNVNTSGGYYGNALQAASCGGHESIVRLLLKNGAEVNARGGKSGNALQAASCEGHENIVRILIENGANVNAEGGPYENALQAACFEGHEEVTRLLIKKGSKVNKAGGYFGSALQAAACGGRTKIVQLLIENGANVNAKGGRSGNALQTASRWGHEDIVQILIDMGADVNAQGGEDSNALQAASSNGHEAIIQLLINKGADVNAQGRHGIIRTALRAASRNGHENICRLLIETGANVNGR
ncbi:ankyrin repeat-containing domain protein [Mycena vulgaris]|nr:ankyrin repeat-containing domain protein [Mycena vulgaris]